MALTTDNLISTLLFRVDNASFRRAVKSKDDIEGDIDVDVNYNVDPTARNSILGTRKAIDDTSKSADSAARSFGGFGAGLRSLGVLGAAVGIVELGRSAISAAVDFEQTQVAFTAFLGSAELANEVLADLQQFSLSTPFEPSQVIAAGQALLAFGEPVETLETSLRQIGDLSAGTGKDFNELAVIFGKARVAGTLFAEDINQLTEAGIPVIQEFAKQLGVSEDQVKKLGSEGKISFENLQQAFEDLTGEGGKFFALTANQAETIGGLASTLSGAFNALLKNVGDAILPIAREILPPLIEGLFSLVDVVRRVAEPIGNLIVGAFRGIGIAIAPVIESVKNFFSIFSTGQPAVISFQRAINLGIGVLRVLSNVVSGIINSLTDLFSRFTEGERVVGRFRPVLDFLTRTFFVFGEIVQNIIGRLGDLIDSFSSQLNGDSVIGKFASFIGDAFSKIPSIIGGIIRVVESFDTIITDTFDEITLRAKGFISDTASLLNPSNLVKLLSGELSLDDLFVDGREFRRLADEYEGLGEGVANAFNAGFQEVQDQIFEFGDVTLPAPATNENKTIANRGGKDLGEELADGIGKGVAKGLSAQEGSVAAIEKALSDLRKKISITSTEDEAQIQFALDEEKLERELAIAKARLDALRSVELKLEFTDDDPFVGANIEGLDSTALKDQLAADLQELDIFQKEQLLAAVGNEEEQNRIRLEGLRERRQILLDSGASTVQDVLDLSIQIAEAEFALEEERTQKAKEESDKRKELAAQTTQALLDFGDQLLQAEIDRRDAEIAVQQQRVSEVLKTADEGNAEQVQLEEERLRAIEEKRERAVQNQRRLAALEIATQNAIAIANGIRLVLSAPDAFTAIANGVIVATTIASTIATLSNAFSDIPSFAVGTDYFDPKNPDRTGGAPATLHRGEGVIPEHINKQLIALGTGATDPNLPHYIGSGLGMYAGARIKPELMQGERVNVVITQQKSIERLEVQNRALTNQMKRIEKAVLAIGQEVNITEDGIYIATKNASERKARRKKLRR